MIRVLIASGQFMAEVPTNEQGYPASTVRRLPECEGRETDNPAGRI